MTRPQLTAGARASVVAATVVGGVGGAILVAMSMVWIWCAPECDLDALLVLLVGLAVGAALAFPGAYLLASRVERSQSRAAKLFLASATSFLLVSVGTGVVTREVYIETHYEIVADGRTYTGQREPPGILLASVSLAGGLFGGALGLGLRARALGREELRRLRL